MLTNRTSFHPRGFTLIELLVVIAIIGILAAIGVIAMQGARERARDAKRKSDIGTVRSALALYYDSFGGFPASSSFLQFNNTSGTGHVLHDALVGNPRFIAQLPDTPTTGEWYYYASCTSSTGVPDGDYTLYATMEQPVTVGSVWVSSYSKSTTQEEASAACPQT